MTTPHTESLELNATPSPSGRRNDRPVLVRFRRVGFGDQRLTVFEDGLVRLDERRRVRDSTWLTITAHDLDRLRAALERIPKQRWSLLPTLSLRRVSDALDRAFELRENLGASYYKIWRGRRSIAGSADRATDLTAVALLDHLRAQAMRIAEEHQPTR